MPPKILLVDDVSMFLEIQKGFLKQSSVHVLTARDGVEALAKIKNEQPALVFMDLNMPTMDGAECCARLKADPLLRHLPVIMITAEGKDDDRERCIRAGCDEFLTKPLDRVRYLDTARKYVPAIDRRDARVPCRGKVMFQAFGVTLSGEAVNVSANGIYVAADYEVKKGTLLELEFALPDGKETRVKGRGRVAWVNHGTSRRQQDLLPGFGVEFLTLTADGAEVMSRYMERHR